MSIWQNFHGPNAGFVVELYERYQQDPTAVDEATRAYFEENHLLFVNGDTPATPSNSNSPISSIDMTKVVGVVNLAEDIREYGHLAAKIDPLGLMPPPDDPNLTLDYHGLTEADLRQLPGNLVGGSVGETAANAWEAIEKLRQIYCHTIGYDYAHLREPEERHWLREVAESRTFSPELRPIRAEVLLTQLTRIEAFEQFCDRAFPGKTRFSIEGLDMMVPILTRIVGWTAGAGITNITLGMAHRGRLNVLAHLLYKDYAKILTEFKDPLREEVAGTGWSGDVKYHAGNQLMVKKINPEFWDKGEQAINLAVSMAPNPSHLEHVNPVVMGMARAAGTNLNAPRVAQFKMNTSLPIIIHGDASFSGQGIVAETLNLSRLEGYNTGGSIHIIANNQVGFTTNPVDSRSTIYASDVAKGFKMPIVHVNADDPEACLEVARLAAAYLTKFRRDFVIDLVGYRRWGHNEGDEPRFTQPLMYKVIEKHPTVREIWANTMAERGLFSLEEAEAKKKAHLDKLQHIYDTSSLEAKDIRPSLDIPPEGAAKGVKTKISAERLREINDNMLQFPTSLSLIPGVRRIFQRQQKAVTAGDVPAIEWGFAESLAFASILSDGVPIRLTGEDVKRGTFGHRQAVVFDTETGAEYVLLQHLSHAQAAFEIYNSPLTENAALGFEYGFSIQRPDCMVIWEGQYGDFINGAQAIIDEFVVSGWAKWNQHSSLILLLPHGYEGRGPDHSSGRLERFLQLAAETNIRVANPTTPAQYFHLLRRQAAPC